MLWIGLDQIRFDTIVFYGNGYCSTPNIDLLAQGGINFTSSYTTCSLCSPARASMLTGLYAFKHGMGTNCDMYHSLASELARPEDLLHHRFANAGYRCGYAGKWHVGTDLGPRDFGFEGMNLPGYGNIQDDPGFRDYLEKNNLSYSPVSEVFLNPYEFYRLHDRDSLPVWLNFRDNLDKKPMRVKRERDRFSWRVNG